MSGVVETTGVGTVGACGPVRFSPVHRESDPAPALLAVSLTVPMSAEDVVALLWLAIRFDALDDAVAELEADPGFVHQTVLEGLVAHSGFEIEAARSTLATQDSHGGIEVPPADIVEQLRALVARHYGIPPAAGPVLSAQPRRDLVEAW